MSECLGRKLTKDSLLEAEFKPMDKLNRTFKAENACALTTPDHIPLRPRKAPRSMKAMGSSRPAKGAPWYRKSKLSRVSILGGENSQSGLLYLVNYSHGKDKRTANYFYIPTRFSVAVTTSRLSQEIALPKRAHSTTYMYLPR